MAGGHYRQFRGHVFLARMKILVLEFFWRAPGSRAISRSFLRSPRGLERGEQEVCCDDASVVIFEWLRRRANGGTALLYAFDLLERAESYRDPTFESDFHGDVVLQEDRDGNGDWLVSYQDNDGAAGMSCLICLAFRLA
jgi:hypothetical protein